MFVPLQKRKVDMKKKFALILLPLAAVACSEYVNEIPEPVEVSPSQPSLSELARIISELPIRQDQLDEVYDAVNSSSGNGYDEEYMMEDLFNSPGCGVGGAGTKAVTYRTPLRDMLREYLEEKYATKAGAADVESYISSLIDSGTQIYWPYSEDWDGESYPIVTFDPGYGAESNYGYEIRVDGNGAHVVDSVFVDEKTAMERPVWVINTNDDSAFTPLDMFLDEPTRASSSGSGSDEGNRRLYLKDFTMLRNYDSWFGGASEFFVKCGSASGFKASTDSELKEYYPSVTDFMIVVKRKYVGKAVPFEAIMVSDFTSQIDKLAFLIVEDDGGTVTSWNCSATVKYNSKTYGFDLTIPYKDKDDIVWRGQLSSDFFQEGETSGRFGDVMVTFMLE